MSTLLERMIWMTETQKNWKTTKMTIKITTMIEKKSIPMNSYFCFLLWKIADISLGWHRRGQRRPESSNRKKTRTKRMTKIMMEIEKNVMKVALSFNILLGKILDPMLWRHIRGRKRLKRRNQTETQKKTTSTMTATTEMLEKKVTIMT